MPNVLASPVVQTISLDLKEGGRRIVEEPVRYGFSTRSFVEVLFPRQTIEHLKVEEESQSRYPLAPSSLFFQTLQRAYAEHHAFGIRPEVLMYLVNAVVAETVRRYPDDYRHLFTSEAEKVDIHVDHPLLVKGNNDSPWEEAIALFDNALRPRIPAGLMDLMLPDFSTATPESTVASLVGFLDAASPYYDYHVWTMCGVPRVVLFGEAADYRRLASAVQKLAVLFEDHLSGFFLNLLPVIEKIARTAETGQVDLDFWGQIYKQYDGSGGSQFSGWASMFLWYVNNVDYKTKTSTLLVKDERLADWQAIHNQDGIDAGSEPSHVSSVPFTWHYFSEVLPMNFIGGVLGVDSESEGALTPTLNYGVLQGA